MRGRTGAEGRRGAAAVEMAVSLPFVLLLIGGLLEAGHAIEVGRSLCNATREGGRQAATGRLTDAEVERLVRDQLAVDGLPMENVSVRVENLTRPGVDATDAEQLDRLRVTASIPFEDIRLSALGPPIEPDAELVGRAVWPSLKDRPYPDPPEPPIE